jgi:glyoxylase-like metal-dependent hydrolase (beta-lactamase superfamily II)
MFRPVALLAITTALTVSSPHPAGTVGFQRVATADPHRRGFRDADFPRVIELAGDVYAYEDLRSAGDERFTTVSFFVVTSDGVLVADGQGNPAATARLVETIRKTTAQPIRYVVICSDHGDHTGGNSAFPPGVTFIAHPTSKAVLEDQAARRKPDQPAQPLPSETVGDRRTITLGGRAIEIRFLGRAHTGGDLHVYLPRERILFMSEAFLNRVFPAMRSAYPAEWVEVLTKAEAMDVRTYVPGHGFVEEPAVSRAELVAYRQAVEAVIAEVGRLFKAGLTVEQAVEQARFGEYSTWSLFKSQNAIAVRRVYDELGGKLK